MNFNEKSFCGSSRTSEIGKLQVRSLAPFALILRHGGAGHQGQESSG